MSNTPPRRTMSLMTRSSSRRAVPAPSPVRLLLAPAAILLLALAVPARARADAPPPKPASGAAAAPAVPHAGSKDEAVVAATLHLNRAAVLARQGNLAEAEKELIEVDRIRPDYCPGLMQLSTVRYRLDRKTAALADLERAIRKGSEFDDKAFLLAARILSEQRQFVEGQKKLAEWGGSRPVSANFHAAIGLLKLGALELGPAEVEMRRALDIDPANDAALGGMFQLYARLDQYAKLQPFLDRGLKANPRSQGILMLSGNCFMRLERWVEAKDRFERALALDPKNAAALVNRGSAEHHLGETKAAIEDYRKAIALDPKGVEAPVNLATVLEAGGKYAEARDVLLAARGRGIKDLDVLNALSVAYDINGELDLAIATAKESLERDASQETMRKHLAMLEGKKSAPRAPGVPAPKSPRGR